MKLYHPVHNGDISTINFENHNFPSSDWVLPIVGQKEEVASEESRLHTATEAQKNNMKVH